jgi:hypothetical protein
MKGLVNQPGPLRVFHYPKRFFFRDFFCKSLGRGVPGRFAKGKAIQGGRIGVAGLSQQTPPLSAKTMPDRNVIKFINDIFDALARQDEFRRQVYGPSDRYRSNRSAVGLLGRRHRSIHGR